jgi:hypothetical protein
VALRPIDHQHLVSASKKILQTQELCPGVLRVFQKILRVQEYLNAITHPNRVADLGFALRAARRSGKVRLDDFAQIAGVSKQFVSDVEYGKPVA